MKVIGLMGAGLLVVLAGAAYADMPGIAPGFKIKNGSVDLKLSGDTNATAVDWNNDGLKDLLVGEYTGGYITLFLNQGTNINPVFDGGVKVESNGSPISVSYD
ncbi:MAG: hypothetical protein ACYTG7_21560 [Planctomycetota bacterium]|jgi:hypothetical protein